MCVCVCEAELSIFLCANGWRMSLGLVWSGFGIAARVEELEDKLRSSEERNESLRESFSDFEAQEALIQALKEELRAKKEVFLSLLCCLHAPFLLCAHGFPNVSKDLGWGVGNPCRSSPSQTESKIVCASKCLSTWLSLKI